MRSIRILIYTDDSKFSEDPCEEWGISELKNLIAFKTRCIVTVEIDLINRHFDYASKKPAHAFNRLTKTFLRPYHEVWFFGLKQTNLPDSGEPDNELTGPEIEELQEWMTTGGVLLSGDHADEDPSLPNGDPDKKNHATYLGLGRALGIGVPRAGKLRVWKGPPTAEVDNCNTHEGADTDKLDKPKYQADAIPQHLLLAKRQIPHRLFWWYLDKTLERFPILKLPDHMHEGALEEPASFDSKEWPGTSRPTVIARGTDKRFDKKIYDLISAYEGGATAGRIVADSSWHHYLNINLLGFARDAAGHPPPESDFDQIAQFFANLAIWLAPKEIRTGLGYDIIFELIKSPQVREVKNAEIETLGETARHVLEVKVGKSDLYRLFAPSEFEEDPQIEDQLFELLFIGDSLIHLNSTDPIALLGPTIQTYFLGSLIREYYRDLESAGVQDLGSLMEDPISSTRQARLIAAFERQKALIYERLSALSEVPKLLQENR